MRRQHLIRSTLILVLLGLQSSTFVTGTRLWPFMAFCMYADSRGPGTIAASRHRTVAQTASGEELDVDLELTGLSFFALKERYLSPLRKGDASAARHLADRINRRRQDPVVAFSIETERFEITSDGIIRSKTVAAYSVTD